MPINKEQHQFIMIQILKEIYSDIEISSLLGFKGGTAAFLFYGLSRFSVDLDFDLLDISDEKQQILFGKMEKILLKYGEITDSQKKHFTIFFSLSYEKGQQQIKVEINLRKTGASYEVRNYLGISMLVADKKSMLAGKLIALLRRKEFAARDVFDAYFFLQNNWDIEENVLAAYEMGSKIDCLEKCIALVENIPDNKLLFGLGELIDEKQKAWVKNDLKKDTIFLLRLVIENETKRLQK